jgi:hypothetical protein
MQSARFEDLETRGFVLVPSFLSEAEIRVCREDYSSQPVNNGNRNYNLSPAGGRVHEAIERRVKDVLAVVAARTRLRPDLPLGGCYFATGRGIQFGWHQDHESFFAIQNHYDYLNFYIPVMKPRKDRSNLCVIPFDVLERESPETYAKLVRGGATSFVKLKDGKTIVIQDDAGAAHVLSRDLDRLAVTPELDPGDLLLLRGDVIHRTQDTETERVSLSFRAASATTLVRRGRLAHGGPNKAWIMMNDADTYERMFRAFDAAGRDAVGYAELKDAMSGIRESDMGRKRFFRYLLKQKRRERVLLRFFGRTVSTAATVLAASWRARRGAA